MHLVILHLTPTGSAVHQRIEPSDLANAIRARAGPGAAPEHVSTRIASAGLHVGLFYRTQSKEMARECAEQLARRVVEEMPMFAGWKVDGTEPGAFR